MTATTITLNITDQFCKDILTTAVEGGIVYWCGAKKIERDADLNVLKIVGPYDIEDRSEKWADIDFATVRLGMERLASPEFKISDSIRADAMAFAADPDYSGWDADTADAIVQAGLFGELVYG